MPLRLPQSEEPYNTLYYVRGDETTLGGSYCVSSMGKSGFKDSQDWARDAQHNPRTAEPPFGLAVKASLRPHVDRIAVSGGQAQEGPSFRKGDTAVQRAAVASIPDIAPAVTPLVHTFQESQYFKKTTEQLRVAGRYPQRTSNNDYGANAYGVRAHVAVPWIAKHLNH